MNFYHSTWHNIPEDCNLEGIILVFVTPTS